MRAWRAQKAAGAAVLGDGVYVLPAADARRRTLHDVATDVRASGGQTRLLDAASTNEDLRPRFDRHVASHEKLKFTAPLTAITAAVVGVIEVIGACAPAGLAITLLR